MRSFFSRIFFPSSRPAAIPETGNDVASYRIHVLFLLSVALTVVIFVFDMTTAFQTMVCTVPYAFLVLVCIWMPSWYFPVAVSVVTVLVLLGFIHSSHNSQWGELAFNRSFCLIGIWVTAIFCQMYKQAQKTVNDLHIQLLHTEKLTSIGKLSGSIAHEFNNPIYGVRNILEQTLEHLDHDKEFKPLLTLAVKECNRMASLIAKLRDFYNPSSSDHWVLMDIHEAIDDMISLNKSRWSAQKILIARNYAPDMPKIGAISDQIKQVILNLLQNAEESFPSKEGGEITIITKVFPETIEVQVQDTGAGIAQEHIGSIFLPFFTTKPAVKGTGLGLAVTYGIIKNHAGDIRVESQPGKGTTFIITLPIKYSGRGDNFF